MPSTAIPSKTPSGVDELKHRVRRLSQRHRTVLLLVDGRRSLAEVLGLSHKAGSSTQHFQELLELGLVELPREPEPPPPPDSGPGALDTLRVESVDLPVVLVEAEPAHEVVEPLAAGVHRGDRRPGHRPAGAASVPIAAPSPLHARHATTPAPGCPWGFRPACLLAGVGGAA